jgi:hypothetical protein
MKGYTCGVPALTESCLPRRLGVKFCALRTLACHHDCCSGPQRLSLIPIPERVLFLSLSVLTLFFSLHEQEELRAPLLYVNAVVCSQ